LVMTHVIEPHPLMGARSLPLMHLRKALREGGREGGKDGEVIVPFLLVKHNSRSEEGRDEEKQMTGTYFFSPSLKLCRTLQKFLINSELASSGSCNIDEKSQNLTSMYPLFLPPSLLLFLPKS